LKVEPWVIQNFKKLSLDKFLKILNKQRADYSIKFIQHEYISYIQFFYISEDEIVGKGQAVFWPLKQVRAL